MKKTLIALLFITTCCLSGCADEHPPGMLVTECPLQEKIDDAEPLNLRQCTITPLARYTVRARVLSRRDYRHDRTAGLAPVDLALGWREMSDSAVIDNLHISQRGRWYLWRRRDTENTVSRAVIEHNSANVHIIPAAPEIKKALKYIHKGSIVTLEGCLVRVDSPDGWHWQSSLSRTDTGGGSCEVMLVEALTVERG